MSYFTQPLISKQVKTKLFAKPQAQYYLAASIEEGTFFLWFETKVLGKAACYPCIIRGDEVMELKQEDEENSAESNTALCEEWERLISPEKLSEFKWLELEGEDIKKTYRMLRDVETDVFPLYEKLGIEL